MLVVQIVPAWSTLLDKLEQFVRRAVAGMLTGGFHTPNHRWVIASALVQAHALFPDLDVAATVDAYLAEGIDVDAEGLFIERSIGVYDAVNDRSWLLIAERRECPEALDAVARNLDLDLHFLHADGTAETGLSRRQDYGTRTVPLGLAHCYLLYNALRPNSVYVQAAQMFWEKSDAPAGHLLWLAYPLLKYGDPAPPDAMLPDDFALFLPLNGIWRARRGRLSASAFRNTTRLFSFVYGKAELSCVKISQTYFGHNTGRFISDDHGRDRRRRHLALRRIRQSASPRLRTAAGLSRAAGAMDGDARGAQPAALAPAVIHAGYPGS